ncbi:MAG TPA: gamma-glutamyltransferase [Vicinamibacterales bacterium]|nr:gamma-glutamyltransferase [Vicinamibacterales bacterium]
MASRVTPDYIRTAIDRTQARSVVMSTGGIVASEHPLASQAGASVLARGGHAVDAAIAVNAVMNVVAPMSNGIGGDLFAIVYDAPTGTVHGINGSGYAPAALTIDGLHTRGITSMPQSGILAVTVPGAVAAWSKLHGRFGRHAFGDLLSAAIRIAEDGFPVPEIVAAEWGGSEGILGSDAEASRVYMPHGRAPRIGEIFRNPDLAATYRALAAGGRDAFYCGEIARRIARCAERHQGALSAADLATYDAEWVTPLSTTYRGWTVHEQPPNGQGLAALMMLNLIEHAPIGSYGHNSVDALHTIIEAKKLAYADLQRYVCDPAFHQIPQATLISKSYAAQRVREIDPARANPAVSTGTLSTEGGDTIYLGVVDRDGNIVSLIQSNFANFGSGVVPEGTGFALQNRGGMFTLDPMHPNALAPRKRPLHTIIPGFMKGPDQRHVAFGIMGGWNQAQAHVQFISNVVDHGMNIQAALEAARVTKITFTGCDVVMESRVPEPVRAALAARGHEIDLQGSFSSLVGGGQAVARDNASGVNFGASDPRKDGAAVPEPVLS